MPGPGHVTVEYDWSRQSHAGVFGTSKRGNLAETKLAPGPGNYNPNERNLGTAPCYSMGYKKAGGKGGESLPGPGTYNPKVDYAKENLGNVKIGTSTRVALQNSKSNPGPGNYNIHGSLGGPSFGIGTSNRGEGSGIKDKTPGPGQYKVPSYISTLPKYTMPDKSEDLRFV